MKKMKKETRAVKNKKAAPVSKKVSSKTTTVAQKKSATKKAATTKKAAVTAIKTTALPANTKMISKENLIKEISAKAKISLDAAKLAYEVVLLESPSYRNYSTKTVELKDQVAVAVPSKPTIKEVKLVKEKPIRSTNTVEKLKKIEITNKVIVPQIKEVIKKVEVIREVPVEKIVEKIKTVEVIKEVIVEKIIEKIKEVEVIKNVPVPVEKIIEIIKEVEVIKEVPVYVEKPTIKEVKVIKEVPIEVLKEITLIREVLVEKLVEIIKEVPVEIIKEIEVVKQIDFAALTKMMQGMKHVEVSKTVVGESRTKGKETIVERREVKATQATKEALQSGEAKIKSSVGAVEGKPTTVKVASKTTTTTTTAKTAQKTAVVNAKADDLTKIEGIGPKIASLLLDAKISTFAELAKTSVDHIKSILDKAGSKFQMHDPATWPQQSALAADGKWAELKTLQDKLDGGKK